MSYIIDNKDNGMVSQSLIRQLLQSIKFRLVEYLLPINENSIYELILNVISFALRSYNS